MQLYHIIQARWFSNVGCVDAPSCEDDDDDYEDEDEDGDEDDYDDYYSD